MKIELVTAIVAFLGRSQAAFLDNERDLQSSISYVWTTKSLSFYGTNITVPYSSKLGCGACINSGYTYCVQGS